MLGWGLLAPLAAAQVSAAGQAPPRAAAAPSTGLEAVRLLLRDGRFAEAELAARAAVRASPDDPRASFYLGLCLHKSKRHGEALLLLERAAEAPPAAFPEAPHAVHYLGWCRYYLGDLAGARAAFERHASGFPEYDDTQFALGLVAYEEDRLPDAEARFRRALELLGRTPGSSAKERAKNLARLGDVLLRQDRLADAERCYRDAVRLWPTHGEAWSKLARSLDRQGRGAEADAARTEQARIRAETERTESGP